MRYTKYVVGIVILIIIGFFALSLKSSTLIRYIAPHFASAPQNTSTTTIKIGNSVLGIDIADTFDERAHGLSDTLSLPQDKGLFFDFHEDNRWGIWMKDMHYPIDIIWLDAANTISYVKTDVATSTYPTTFFSDKKTRYVLETNAGFFAKSGAKIGDQVVITEK